MSFINSLKFWRGLTPEIRSAPEYICFDLLYSEYLSMKVLITDPQDVAAIESLEAKKNEETLGWKDLYQFELILLPHFTHEQLRSRIIRFRSDYQSIASEKEYAGYQASKPPEVQSPPDFTNLNMTKEEYNQVLREDFKDLLNRMFLKYAILPIREKRLMNLTRFAAALCLIALVTMLGILLTVFLAPLVTDLWTWDSQEGKAVTDMFLNSPTLSSLTVFVVVASGAMGGFVSALQRIQSQPNEGDSLYNLSLLFHGSNSVFVAPITGAIFATLLYLMFAAGILQGTFFPFIYTPGSDGPVSSAGAEKTDPTENGNSNLSATLLTRSDNSNGLSNTLVSAANRFNSANALRSGNTDLPGANSVNNNANNANVNIGLANSNTNKVGKGKSTPTPEKKKTGNDTKEPTKGLDVFDFLARSGPANGKAYALLIIWCFIAGFAERFVPDALDRLILNSKPNAK
jgi:hypothetical protein